MKIAGILLGMIGILLFGFGGVLLLREVLYLQRAELTTATVTGNQRYTYTGQVNEYGVQHYYCSQFQFQTKDGRTVSYEETDTQCTELDMPPHYQVGEKVELYYDPRHPGSGVQIHSFREQYRDALAALIAGGLFMLMGLLFFVVGWLRGRKAVISRASVSRSVR